MGDPAIESESQDRPARLKDIDSTKILPACLRPCSASRSRIVTPKRCFPRAVLAPTDRFHWRVGHEKTCDVTGPNRE
jgi:hypothetical protein